MAGSNWYHYGTITVNQNSNHVIGSGTKWADIGVKTGDIFTIDSMKIYEIDTVTDNENLTLKTAFAESSAVNVHYSIIRNFTDISTADIVAQMSELQVNMKTYIDTEMSTLTGKSAYEVACSNGFVGTESEWLASLNAYGIAKAAGYTGTQAEWLESLKAAGEWTSANNRITTLENSHGYLDGIKAGWSSEIQYWVRPYYVNSFPRFKNLGNTVDFSKIGIASDFDPNTILSTDQYRVGDYWNLNIGRAVIVQMDYTQAHIALCTNRNVTMNDTATTEGGYKNSKMHNEYLPELLADLEAEVGAENLGTFYDTHVIDSNVLDQYGEEHYTAESTKIQLFCLDNMFKNPKNQVGNQSNDLLAFFELNQTVAYSLLNTTTWLQDVAEYNPTTNFVVYSPTFCFLRGAAANSLTVSFSGGLINNCIMAHVVFKKSS